MPNFSKVGKKPFSSTRRPRSDNVALNFMPEQRQRGRRPRRLQPATYWAEGGAPADEHRSRKALVIQCL